MNAMKVGLLLLELVSSATFDEAVGVIATTTTLTYEEAAYRLSCLLTMPDYQLEMPTEAYQLIISSGFNQIVHLLDEFLLEEAADTLNSLCNVEAAPTERLAERQNPIMGLSAADGTFPAYKRHERWHTAATGE